MDFVSLNRRVVQKQINSVHFTQTNITYYDFASEDLTICTHTKSLYQELTSGQEKLQRNRKKLLIGKKGKNSSGEQQRRIPLQDGHVQYMSHVHSMNMTECMNSSSRHGPRSRPPQSMRQKKVERSGRGISRTMAGGIRHSQVQWTL